MPLAGLVRAFPGNSAEGGKRMCRRGGGGPERMRRWVPSYKQVPGQSGDVPTSLPLPAAAAIVLHHCQGQEDSSTVQENGFFMKTTLSKRH